MAHDVYLFSNMKKKNLVPLVLFAVIFLLYSLYFVKVVNVNKQLEKDSIAKTVKRMIQLDDGEDKIRMPQGQVTEKKQKISFDPGADIRYVNFSSLNVRKRPTLASGVIEKVIEKAPVQVMEFTTPTWAKIKTQTGTIGYVAKKYLSEAPTDQKKESIVAQKIKSIFEPKEEAKIVASKDLATKTAKVTSDAPRIFDVPIVLYHHISDDLERFAKNLVLPEKNLIAQLDYLIANDIKTITFHDLKKLKEEGKEPAGKAVILTIDDGYDDAYIAAQHLNGKGLKAVFFIITDKIGTAGYLDWRQVKKMRSWGMEIGSHGVTSADLRSSSEFFIKDELQRSKQIIEDELGEDIISYAYPAGGFTADAIAVVEEVGYSFARSIRSGSRYSELELYKLPVLRVFFPAGARQFDVWFGN